MALSKEKFQELLARARAAAASRKEQDAVEAADALSSTVEERNIHEVDLTLAGASEDSTDEERQEVIEGVIGAIGAVDSRADTKASYLSSLNKLSSILSPKSDRLESSASSPIAEQEAIRGIGVTRNVVLNDKQQLFNTTVLAGGDCVLIGAAGTGKTTSMRTVTRNLIDSKRLAKLTTGTRWLIAGNPGAAILSFTRKAVNNIRHAVVEELKAHTLTIHKLLEYQPEFFEIEDPKNPGEFKNSMRFAPTKGEYNPLPRELTFLAFEESSMISVELYELLQKAMPHAHQEVFLGDIQQLPPIFGQAILGFKMLALPVVELTEVYRQARESPIIDLAWKILAGDATLFNPKTETYKLPTGQSRLRVPTLEALSRSVVLEDGSTSEVKFQIWQKPLNVDYAVLTSIKQLCAWEAQGYYNADEDTILCPFNKSVGTIEINKGISDYLGKKRNAEVHEVIAGFNKHYLAVGDRVLYDKEDAFITGIRRNGKYFGKAPQPAHTKLDRWGHIDHGTLTDAERLTLIHNAEEASDIDMDAVEAYIEALGDESEDRVQSASHVVELRYSYSDEIDEPIVLESAGEINNLLGGYCITVHKFQGSEADRVFLLLHHTHATMVQRELLYTAVTRAKRFLHIICEKDTFFKGVKSQKIKGNTIAEKAEWFKGKQAQMKLEKEKERDQSQTQGAK